MSTNPKKRNKQAQAAPAREPQPQRVRQKQKKPPMMAIRIVLYGIVAFVVARRNRNNAGGATAGPLTALANRLLGQTGDAATGAPAAEAGAAAPQTARRPADESEGDEFDD